MPGVVHISEAASLGLHAMILLASDPARTFRTKEMAGLLRVSEDHLAKVLQRLVRAELVGSMRGPRGGFTLGRDAADIRLLDIYETIEGPLKAGACLLGERRCELGCVLGDFITTTNEEFRRRFAQTRLADVANVLGRLTP